jgi:hypothetical protein
LFSISNPRFGLSKYSSFLQEAIRSIELSTITLIHRINSPFSQFVMKVIAASVAAGRRETVIGRTGGKDQKGQVAF